MHRSAHQHQHFMRMALDYAEKIAGSTHPNPPVVAIVVKHGRVLAMAHTDVAGGQHAEARAIALVSDEQLSGADIYVTLEPCSHHGKNPPCAELIINKNIKTVIIATLDPNPLVAGRGMRLLQDAGVICHLGIAKARANKLYQGFFRHITLNQAMPMEVALKIATSLDAKIALANGHSKWITNDIARRYAHLLRSRYQAIMVGTNTALGDNPMLDCRLNGLEQNSPIIVLPDYQGRILAKLSADKLDEPVQLALFNNHKAKVVVLTAASFQHQWLALAGLIPAQLSVLVTQRYDLVDGLRQLSFKLQISSLLVEGGGALLTAFLKAGLVDKIYHFQQLDKLFGDDALPAFADLGFTTMAQSKLVLESSHNLVAGCRVQQLTIKCS
jgi:diaminohydroxyphosphoribosylaminopyrimidine deaminase/5-amino-6-(5-phosphoribosylamino)uracil reductase